MDTVLERGNTDYPRILKIGMGVRLGTQIGQVLDSMSEDKKSRMVSVRSCVLQGLKAKGA